MNSAIPAPLVPVQNLGKGHHTLTSSTAIDRRKIHLVPRFAPEEGPGQLLRSGVGPGRQRTYGRAASRFLFAGHSSLPYTVWSVSDLTHNTPLSTPVNVRTPVCILTPLRPPTGLVCVDRKRCATREFHICTSRLCYGENERCVDEDRRSHNPKSSVG